MIRADPTYGKTFRSLEPKKKGLFIQNVPSLPMIVEAVVEATDISIGLRTDNNLASMFALPVWTLLTACSFYPLTNTKFVKAGKIFAHTVCVRET